MSACTIRLLLLVSQFAPLLADHQLAHREIAEANSTRELKHANQTIRFAWLDIENRTEPKWRFLLNGIDMDLLLPHSWNLTRTDRSIELKYTSEVNFEMLARNGTYFSVEAEVKDDKSSYSRVVFERKFIWEVGSGYVCDEISQGTYCERCTKAAKLDALRADACIALMFADNRSYFMSVLLTPTVVGCVLLLGQALIWTLFCLKVWKEGKETEYKPSQKKTSKKNSDIELIISDPRLAEGDDAAAANASTSNSKLAKRDWEPAADIAVNSSKFHVEKHASTHSNPKTDEVQPSTSATKKTPPPEKKKMTMKVKDKPVLERIIAQNRTKGISKRLLAIEQSRKVGVEVNADTEGPQTESSQRVVVKGWPTSAQVADVKTEEN